MLGAALRLVGRLGEGRVAAPGDDASADPRHVDHHDPGDGEEENRERGVDPVVGDEPRRARGKLVRQRPGRKLGGEIVRMGEEAGAKLGAEKFFERGPGRHDHEPGERGRRHQRVALLAAFDDDGGGFWLRP